MSGFNVPFRVKIGSFSENPEVFHPQLKIFQPNGRIPDIFRIFRNSFSRLFWFLVLFSYWALVCAVWRHEKVEVVVV